jgi:hypothetical protein
MSDELTGTDIDISVAIKILTLARKEPVTLPVAQFGTP